MTNFKSITSVLVMLVMVAGTFGSPVTVIAQETGFGESSFGNTEFGNTDSFGGNNDFGSNSGFGFDTTEPEESTQEQEESTFEAPEFVVPEGAEVTQGGDTQVSSGATIKCSLFASAEEIITGGSVTLNWETQGFNGVTINGESVGNGGFKTFSNILENTTYTLRGISDSGSDCEAQVIVFCLPPEEPKFCELEILKTVDKHTAKPGDTLTYTITVENTGTADCTGGGVKIYDVVDHNLEYHSNTISNNLSEGYGNKGVYTEGDRTLRFNGHVLEPGEKGTITWTGKVKTPGQCGDFEVRNQAKVTARELNHFKDWVYSQTVKTQIDYECDKPMPPQCPLEPAEGRTIVDFGDNTRLFSSRGLDQSQTQIFPVSLTAGSYDVTLVSYDGYVNRVNASQPNEKYVAQFLQGDSVVATSNEISDLADNVVEATNNELVNTDLVLASSVDGIRAVHAVYPDTSSPNSLQPICLAIDEKPEEPKGKAKVIASKIICTDESQLPNFGTGGPDITETTAADWVAANDTCQLVPGWHFEWTDNQSADPGDDFTGPAGAPWNSFGPTDVNGQTEVEIDLEQVTASRVWFREVLKTGFIPFTHGLNGNTNVDNVSAEFYCHKDVVNYDNRDFVSNLEKDETYHCVAWNSPEVETPVPSCDSFTATPATIVVGASTTLAWESTNATQAFINNAIGSVPVDGSIEVSPIVDTTYRLTLIGAEDKTADCEIPVNVSEDPVPVCEFFTATPNSLPVGGGDVTLDWSVTDAVSAAITPTVGTVDLVGTTSVNITQGTTFTLTAIDDNGDEVTCPAPVAVADPEPVFSCADNVSFSLSDTSIKRGQTSTLTWNVTDADSVNISQINATSFSGSQSVSPNVDTTYVLTATKGQQTVNCPVELDIDSGGGGGNSSSPRCELTISDSRIEVGEEITLTWETSRANEVTLTDDRGEVIFTTDDMLSSDKEDFFDGEITLRPTRDTEYTLLVERGSRDRECRVEVELEEEEIVVLETRSQEPLVAGISLSQVPHTGFEAGPIMTYLFYTLLVTWALFIAYLLVIRNRVSEPVVEYAPSVTEFEPESITKMKEAEAKRPDVFSTTTAPVTAQVTAAPVAEVALEAPVNLPTGTPVIGYENQVEEVAVNPHQVTDAIVTELENRAHMQKALLSSDAVRYFVATTEGLVERNEALDEVITEAKKNYPLEDGWIVVNEARMRSLCEVCLQNASETPVAESFVPATVPEGSSSLAEAIVTGNVAAAYEMVGSRPMFSLADAAADLDAVYRHRRGGAEAVSDLLISETANLSDEQIQEVINALTGALDGTYTDEASAVKMAIMKAVKAIG